MLGGRPQKRKISILEDMSPLREGHRTGWQAVAITPASPGGAARAAHALPPAYSRLQRERARALPMNVVARGRSCILRKKTVLPTSQPRTVPGEAGARHSPRPPRRGKRGGGEGGQQEVTSWGALPSPEDPRFFSKGGFYFGGGGG